MSVDDLFGNSSAAMATPRAPARGKFRDEKKIDANLRDLTSGDASELDVSGKKKRNANYALQSRAYWVRKGYVYVPVDRFNAYSGMTTDLCGLWDAMVWRADEPGVTGIQFTSHDGLSSHISKACKAELIPMTGTPSKVTRQAEKRPDKTRVDILKEFLNAGNRALICTYEKEGIYEEPRIFELTLEVVAAKESGKRMKL